MFILDINYLCNGLKEIAFKYIAIYNILYINLDSLTNFRKGYLTPKRRN